MQCRSCPYGREDFERRMYWYNKIKEERGIPNDIYYDLQPEEAADEFEQFLWCDKVGRKVYGGYRCEDAFGDLTSVNLNRLDQKKSDKQKKQNKRFRNQKHKEHLKHLHEISKGRLSPVTYKQEVYTNGCDYIENPKPYYKRSYRGKRSKYLKKQSARKIRRYQGELHNGWQCHKLYDFWWKYD